MTQPDSTQPSTEKPHTQTTVAGLRAENHQLATWAAERAILDGRDTEANAAFLARLAACGANDALQVTQAEAYLLYADLLALKSEVHKARFLPSQDARMPSYEAYSLLVNQTRPFALGGNRQERRSRRRR